MTTIRRLAAILAADVAGYSRLIGSDEAGTLGRLRAIRAEVIDPAIAAHNGRLVRRGGTAHRNRASGPGIAKRLREAVPSPESISRAREAGRRFGGQSRH